MPGLHSSHDNAFWNGYCMTYGDGQTYFDIVTSLDVIAHEIGHGVCQFSANLVYSGESGAINESLSDIWGACVENWATTNKQTWLIGEDITLSYPCLRNMQNPGSTSLPSNWRQPDTYGGGPYWTGPNADVHINSGIMNHWFYILSVGKSGTNGIGNTYNVTGIGISKAEKIAYRAETVYMTVNTNFAYARTHTIQAAIDLYGDCSPEVQSVTNAWYAVGVGNQFLGKIIISNTSYNLGTHSISGCIIEISNTTIEPNTTVKIHGYQSVVLKPGFQAKAGSNVIITAGEQSKGSPSPGYSPPNNDNTEELPSLEKLAVESPEIIGVDFTIYPNPNDGNFMIKISGEEQPYMVEIFNHLGGLLGYVNCNEGLVNINRTDLNTGIYYVKITMDEKTAVKKILVH
jgi:hypothetical protein